MLFEDKKHHDKAKPRRRRSTMLDYYTYDANDISLEGYIKGKEINFSMNKGRPSADNLVVCRTSVVKKWEHEIYDKVTKKFNLFVLVYHGSNRKKDLDEFGKHEIVLITYSIISMDVKK